MGSNLSREPWNKGKLVGQKPPLKPKDVWAIRIHLQNAHAVRDLALFNLAIVTDRRNRAGDGRPNEATQSSPETQFRMVSRMRFFA
jgi:hypothetical protein